jgi:hypothetical protein
MATHASRKTRQWPFALFLVFFVRGTDVIAAAVVREGDAESVQY